MFRENLTQTKITEAKAPKGLPQEYKNLVRYIPSGAQVIADLGEKSLKLKIITSISAPPLNTGDIKDIDRRLRSDTKMFIKDVNNTITLKDTRVSDYIFMTGKENHIEFLQELTFVVSNKVEGKKLALLYEAMAFYTGRKEPMR